MDFLSLCIVIGIMIMLSLFVYELKNPNKLGNTATTHNSPQSELTLFYISAYINISLQCYYLGHYTVAVYNRNASNIVGGNALFIIGFIVCLIGSFLRTKAKQELGAFFTYQLGVSDGQKLITTGLYSHIKHPSYLGMCMMYIGISIAFQSVIMVATFVLLVFLTTIRIAKEEELLEEKFGTEFQLYSEKRWKMLPYVF